MKIKRTISVTLIFVFLTSTLCGCIGRRSSNSGGYADSAENISKNTATITKENPVAELSGIRIDFCSMNIEGEKKVSVAETKSASEDGEAMRMIYDITLENQSEFQIPIEITLPYDPNACVSGKEGESVAAQYFNPKTNEWEPILFGRVDTTAKTITFLTNHLSKYSVYQFSNLGTPRAEIAHLVNMPETASDFDPIKVIEEFLHDSEPGPVAEASFAEMLEYYIDTGNLHKGAPGYKRITEGLGEVEKEGFGIYLEQFAKSIEKGFTLADQRISSCHRYGGLALAGYRIAKDLNERGFDAIEDTGYKAYETLFMDMSNWTGTTASSIAALAIVPIKYSIEKVQEQAYNANYEGTVKAYKAYYKDSSGEYLRSDEDWAKLFIECHIKNWQNSEPSAQKLYEDIDAIIVDYCSEFWRLDDFDKALEGKLGGNDTWVHPNMIPENEKVAIRFNFYLNTLQRLQDGAFIIFDRYLHEKAQSELAKPFLQYMGIMNRPVTITLDEDIDEDSWDEPQYHGYYVRLEFSDTGKDAGFITEQLPEEGSEYELPWFTLFGYLQFGMPDQISLYKDRQAMEDGNAALSIQFELEGYDTWLYIDGSQPSKPVKSYSLMDNPSFYVPNDDPFDKGEIEYVYMDGIGDYMNFLFAKAGKLTVTVEGHQATLRVPGVNVVQRGKMQTLTYNSTGLNLVGPYDSVTDTAVLTANGSISVKRSANNFDDVYTYTYSFDITCTVSGNIDDENGLYVTMEYVLNCKIVRSPADDEIPDRSGSYESWETCVPEAHWKGQAEWDAR